MTTIYEGNKYGISKLNDSNYHVWKQRMILWLIKDDLWEVISDPPPNPLNDKWLKRDQKAKATIGLTIEDRYLTDIKHSETAKEVWKKLEKIHQSDTLGSRLVLYRKIMNAKYSAELSMSEHISNILDAASKLEDRGHRLSEELICAAILGSLTSNYNPLITAIEGRSSEELTINYVREKLIEEHRRLNSDNDTEEPITKALRSDVRSNALRSRTPPICYYCNKVGHLRRDCRLLKSHDSHQRFIPGSARTPGEETRNSPPPQSRLTTIDSHLPTDISALSTHLINNKYPANYWIIDSGATAHMVKDYSQLSNIVNVKPNIRLFTADGKTYDIDLMGECNISIKSSTGEDIIIHLTQVYYSPHLYDNLLSIPQLTQQGYEITFQRNGCTITVGTQKGLLGSIEGHAFIHSEQHSRYTETTKECANICEHIWHQRLGHRNDRDIQATFKLYPTDKLINESCLTDDICDTCQKAKMANKKFQRKVFCRAKAPFEALHSDLCGPISPETLGGNKYTLSIIDEYSRYATIYLIPNKYVAKYKIMDFIEKGINEFNRRPRSFRSDGGKEFCNKELENYFNRQGINHHITLPYTPQQNGLSERHNRSLMDTTRSLLYQSKLPKNLWGELSSTATYLLNRVVHKHCSETPYYLWFGRRANLNHIVTIGTGCYYLNPQPIKNKLESRGLFGILIGFEHSDGIYRIWNPETGKICRSRCVSFKNERCPNSNDYNYRPLINPDNSETPEIAMPESIEQPTPVRKSTRVNKGKAPLILTYAEDGNPQSQAKDWYNTPTAEGPDPTTENYPT